MRMRIDFWEGSLLHRKREMGKRGDDGMMDELTASIGLECCWWWESFQLVLQAECWCIAYARRLGDELDMGMNGSTLWRPGTPSKGCECDSRVGYHCYQKGQGRLSLWDIMSSLGFQPIIAPITGNSTHIPRRNRNHACMFILSKPSLRDGLWKDDLTIETWHVYPTSPNRCCDPAKLEMKDSCTMENSLGDKDTNDLAGKDSERMCLCLQCRGTWSTVMSTGNHLATNHSMAPKYPTALCHTASTPMSYPTDIPLVSSERPKSRASISLAKTNWSPTSGATMAGTPARRVLWSTPAPPWLNIHLHRGSLGD